MPWTALYVRTPHYESLTETAKEQRRDHRLAEQLGARDGTILRGRASPTRSSPTREAHNARRLLVGRAQARVGRMAARSGWRRLLVAQGDGFEITVVGGPRTRTPARTIGGAVRAGRSTNDDCAGAVRRGAGTRRAGRADVAWLLDGRLSTATSR